MKRIAVGAICCLHPAMIGEPHDNETGQPVDCPGVEACSQKFLGRIELNQEPNDVTDASSH